MLLAMMHAKQWVLCLPTAGKRPGRCQQQVESPEGLDEQVKDQ